VFMIYGIGAGVRVQGLGSRVQGLGFRVQGPGSRVQGWGFGVEQDLAAVHTAARDSYTYIYLIYILDIYT